jgi:hypothetical protein
MSRNAWQRAAYAQRHGNNGMSAKDVLRGLGTLSLLASCAFWGPVQWQLVNPISYGDMLIAASFTAFLVGGPPVLTSFLIPWSPGGMLLQKINARTWGSVAVLICAGYLFYYSFTVLQAWWGSREVATQTGLVIDQTLVGLIAYIITPALLWAPVSSEELAEQLKQAQLVERYRVQTAADIAILQTTLLRAQQKAAVGFANLTAGEREELAGVMRGLVVGIDETIQEIAGNLSTAAGVTMEFRSPLGGQNEVGQLLDYVAGELKQGRIVALPSPNEAPAMVNATPVQQRVAVHQDASNHRSDGDAIDNAGDALRVAATRPDAQAMAMRDGGAYSVAKAKLLDMWTIKDLQQVLGNCAESTAREYRIAWERAGLVSNQGMPKGRYKFTESEAA